MAKRISDEELKLSIIIDGNPAQQQLSDLEKATRELNSTNKELLKEKRNLERQNKQESEEYKKITAEIRENNKVISENKSKISLLQNEIGLTSLTISQLKREASRLRIVLNNSIPGSEDYIRYERELNAVSNRLNELRGRSDQASNSLTNMATEGKKFITFLTMLIGVLTGAVVSFQKFIDFNGKLSDAQADVRKTTGMTKQEVDELTKSFGLFHTRTARIELLKLAEEGGRLGIEGVKNIQDYLVVANQLKTALGDDLSETQITEVGKMTEQYKIAAETGREFGGAMLSLGSAINEVAQSGNNKAGFLVDFLKRTVGVTTQVKVSAADNLGYAATFDEIGQSAEVSGTMMNKVWMDMSKNTAVYAKIAGMSVKEYSDLLSKDANEATLKFLDGLKGNEEGFRDMILKMDELDEGGARGAQALSALANNTEKLRARQMTANVALIEATSVTDEYEIKNNNLAATLEKIKNRIENWMSSDQFVEWLTNSVEWLAKFIGATEDTDGSVTKFRNGLITLVKVFAVVLAAMVTNTAWQKMVFLWTNRNTEATLLYNLAQKAKAAAEGISIIATQAYAGVLMLLRFNILGAIQAFRVMTATMLTTPWGAILSAISAAATAYVLFKDRNKELRVEVDSLIESTDILTKREAELSATFSKSSSEIKNKVEPLIRVLKNKNTQLDTRKKAYEELIKISPAFLDTVDKEYVATEKLDTVYGNLLSKLKQKLKTQANATVMQKVYEDEAKALLEVVEIESNLEKIRQKRIESDDKATKLTGEARQKQREKSTDIEIAWNREYAKLLDAREKLEEKADVRKSADTWKEKEVNRLELKLKELKKGTEEYLAVEDELNSLLGVVSKTEDKNTSTITPDTQDKKYEKEKTKRLEKIKEYQKERLALEREIEDSILDSMVLGFNQERQKLDTEYTRRLEDIQNKLIKESEIEKAIKASKNKNLTKEERDFYAKQAEHWKTQNEHYQNLQLSTEETFHLKKKSLITKYSGKTVEEQNKAYELEKIARETSFNEQLELLGKNEVKKERLKKDYQKQEREREIEHLKSLLLLYTNMLSGIEIEGIDFSLLTPEAEKKLKEDVAKAELALSQLQAAKAGDKDKPELDLGINNQTDVLGFTTDQWEIFFENVDRGTIGIQTMTMAVQTLQNAWNTYDQLISAQENRRIKQYERNTDERQRRLKRQLDVGIINQEQYNQANQALEADLDRKKAQIEYKQAKRKRAMDIANVITNTALSIMSIWAQVPKADFGATATILSAMVGALGAVQLATIASQPLPMPGFEEGLYGEYVRREQDGKIFNASYGGKTKSGLVNKPTYFLAGEKGPEMIIDNKSFKQLSPDVRDSLINELRTIKGFEGGYYNADTMRVEVPKNSTDSKSDNLEFTLIRLVNMLEKLESNGIEAFITNKNMKNMKNLDEGIKKYNKLKEKAQV